jgi:pyruvate/2-oxoglutarate dehydrogenase complex dihydrolipoamide dehydrogenase (E3) component
MTTTTPVHYDTLIIGGGQAGVPLAYALAGAGQRVALAERKHLGGSCVNFGCTPTKAAIASADLARRSTRAAEFGLVGAALRPDLAAVLARAQRIADASRLSLEEGLGADGGPEWLRAHARLGGRDGELFRVQLTPQDGAPFSVTAKSVVLNTGTRTALPPIDGLNSVEFIHSGNWLRRPKLPGHLLIVGGGYIGLEMSQFYRRMGAEVTVVHGAAEVLDREDPEVSAALRTILEAEGVRFALGHHAASVERSGPGLRLHLDGGEVLEGTHLFLATGRLANTDDLGLETVDLQPGKGGVLTVDERLATPVAGLWAAGDIRGGPMFTHTAWDDYRILESQLIGDGSRTTERIVPYAVFTEPNLARVGLSEPEARASGTAIKVARFEMKQDGKAREIGAAQGFIKLVSDAHSGHLLGATLLCESGAELIHSYIDVMNAQAPVSVIQNAVHIHPTLSEAVQSAVSTLA